MLRALIHRLKYSHQWGLAEPLAQLLQQQVSVEALLDQADLLVPVPLHWKRRMSRGYNQSELLARALAKNARLAVIDSLKRMRDTPHQTAIRSLAQRARNVKDAFSLRGNAAALAGKNVILVDDVYTTGATLRSAARALKGAQVARIDAIVLAVADPTNGDFQTVA